MILLIILGVIWIAGTIASFSSFKYYKSTYQKLVNGNVVFNYKSSGLYWFCEPSNKDKYIDDVVFFTHLDGTISDIKVGDGEYIHGGVLSYMSPYSLYWLFKYKNWFKENKAKFDSIK